MSNTEITNQVENPKVSIIIVTWNAADDIQETISSIEEQIFQDFEIILVDSASTDQTVELVQSHYPSVNVVACEENLGYRRGNRLGMSLAKGEYIVICNDDVRLEAEWLGELVKAMDNDSTLGLATPVILNYFSPELISAAGNTLHYSGMTGHSLARDSVRDYAFEMDPSLAAVSGCCFIIRNTVMHELGGFSDDFDKLNTGWHAASEDADLCLRARLHGYEVGLVPKSVMYHKHDGNRPVTPNLFASAEFARYLLVLRNYETRTLILLIPLFAILEMLSIGFSMLKGKAWLQSKLTVWSWLIRNVKTVKAMRSRVQQARTVDDQKILPILNPTINRARLVGLGPIGTLIERSLNTFFVGYHNFLCFATKL